MVGVADECWPDDLVDTGAKDGVQMRRIENVECRPSFGGGSQPWIQVMRQRYDRGITNAGE